MDLDDFMKKKPADNAGGEPDFGGLDDPMEPSQFGGIDDPAPPQGGGSDDFGLGEPEPAPAPETDAFGEPAPEPEGFGMDSTESGSFDSGDPYSSMGEQPKTGFFGYFKKGFLIAALKKDVMDDVASDSGAFVPALTIYLLPSILAGILLLAAVVLFSGAMMSGEVMEGMEAMPPEAGVLFALGPIAGVGMLVLLPLIALISSIILVGMFHLLAKIFRGDGSFLDFYQTLGVGSIITWFGMIPYIGFLFSLWMIPVTVVVTSRVHNLSIGKSVAVVLIPLAVFILLIISLAMMVGMAAFMGMGGMEGMQTM